jgi:threonine/homoserine/homoserine lactone efflux protein
MTHHWLNILSILGVFTLAIISPGPNFIMVVDTSPVRFAPGSSPT